MGVSLWIEQPPGVKTTGRVFNPNAPKRFAGEAWWYFGVPAVYQGEVGVRLKDSAGNVLWWWSKKPDLYGNYQIDTTLPDTTGNYILEASWDKKTLIDRYDEASPIYFSVDVVVPSVSPVEKFSLTNDAVTVGSSLRASLYLSVGGKGEIGVPVDFNQETPKGESLTRKATTSKDGVAEVVLTPAEVGRWTIQAYIPRDNWYSEVLTFDVSPKPVAAPPPPPPPVPKPVASEWEKYAVPVGLGLAGLFVISMVTRR